MSNGKVGYGNPPRGSRFRAGVSGNPKGRPKREESSVAERIKSLLDTPIEYREGGNPAQTQGDCRCLHRQGRRKSFCPIRAGRRRALRRRRVRQGRRD
jgi:hypothetical protein